MKRREEAGGSWKPQKWRPLCHGNVEASEAGGGPEGSQAVLCELSLPRFPLLSGVLSWPELLVRLGREVRSGKQASKASMTWG